MAARKLVSRFNMTIGAGKATPQPPVGSMLGQRGLKLMDFCKAFNDQTAVYKDNIPVRARVYSYSDRTFEFNVLHPSTTYFLLKVAGLEKGASNPGHEIVGKVTNKQIYHIAQLKMKDFESKDHEMSLRGVARSIVGAARGMGLEVVPDKPKP